MTTTSSVNMEARRLAKITVRNVIRALKQQISDYDAVVISKAAQELVNHDPAYTEQAKINLSARYIR